MFRNGARIPSQPEKELSNLNLDWRKRVVYYADLEPGQMNRCDCRIEILAEKPRPVLHQQNGVIDFQTDQVHVVINCRTGLMDVYEVNGVNGVNYLRPNAFLPLVIGDNADAWGMKESSYRDVVVQFNLMSPEEGSSFSGIDGTELDAVRVIEDGDVRTVVEALFQYGHSFIV